MPKHSSLLVLILACSSLFAQENSGIRFFKGTWAEAKSEAVKQNKLIFVDCYVEWCGPCKWMAKNVFTDSSVGAFYNRNFICYQIDAEKGDGLDFAKEYHIRAYPTLYYIDGNGKEQHVVVGSLEGKAFVKVGEIAMDKNENFAGLQRRYKNGEKGNAFMADFIGADFMAGKDSVAEIYADQYFHSLPEDSLFTRTAWHAIMTWPSTSAYAFSHILNNKARYTQLYGDTVLNFILKHYLDAMAVAIYQKDSATYFVNRQMALDNKTSETEKRLATYDLSYYELANNIPKYVSLSKQYIDEYFSNDTAMLNNIAWVFYEHVDGKKDLALAEQWVKKSCAMLDTYYNNDTYAAVLFKLGKDKEAMERANHALEIGRKTGEDISSTEETLKKYGKAE